MTELPPTPPTPSDRDRWYLPTWSERLRLMKWRIVYAVLPVVLIPLALIAPCFLFLGWKLIVIAIAIPVSALINATRHALRLRTEPFCIHCGYGLTGLPDGHLCPECGMQFHLAEIDDYRRDPHWFIKRRSLNQHLSPTVSIDAGPRRSQKPRDGT